MANKPQFDVLIGIYREAQARLAEIITGNYGAGTRTYYNSVLKQLERLMKQLEAETGQYISTEIPRQYKKALDDTYAYFKRNNLQMKRPDMFSHIHSDAVSELANEMRYHINQGISIAGRRVMRYLDTAKDNALRQAGLRSAALKAAAGQTVADMQKDLMQRLANDGFLTVQYGTGKRAYQVGLDSYAAMVARSTTREAGNLARENQLTENGYDLMMMTEHYPTCEACAVLQGRVYSISGRDKRFPPLSRAFPSGYRNVHPNCRHVMTYWIEEMQSPEEIRAALARSNAPFTDNRSDEEIALYSKQQADSRRMRADRSQFERYRQRLGEDAPKSFHTFRRIKNADGQKWKEMQSLYRSKSPKNVDFSAENDIIKAGSDDVTLENQRYGRNKDTLVNKTYIDSGEYRRKYDNATNNPDVNKALYDCAKTALKHRSGTALEDMYWLDGDTGNIILSVTDSTDERAIVYTEKIKNAIKSKKNIITIHTHPSSMPPSASDLNSNFKNNYKMGFVACHNGKIFGYTSNEIFSEQLNNMYIQKFIKQGYTEFEAQLKALEKLSETFDFKVWEVNFNG